MFRKNESNNSSDQEDVNEKKCVTRIKINTNDEMDFLSLSNLQSSNCSRNLSPCNLCSNNTSSHSLSSHNQTSQNSLSESRSPFINRALPPLPSKERDLKGRSPFGNLKASNSRSDYDEQFGERSDERFDQKCDKKFTNKFTSKKSKQKSADKEKRSTQTDSASVSHDQSDDEDSELNVTNCFKIYRDKDPKKSSKIKNIQNHLFSSARKYSHPPPHLHSSSKVVQFDDDDDEEDENNSNQCNQPNAQVLAARSSLINLNSNLIHHTNASSNGYSSNVNSSTSYSSNFPNSSSNSYSRTDNSYTNKNLPENTNSNQLADEQTRKMMDYAESIEKVKGKSFLDSSYLIFSKNGINLTLFIS